MRQVLAVLISSLLLIPLAASAQEAPPAPEQKKPASLATPARLAAAKTIYVKLGQGSELPFNIISNAFESWGRYLPAKSPEKADLVVEVSAPNEGGVSLYTEQEQRERAAKGQPVKDESGKQLEVNEIKMTVYDGRSKLVLWSSKEQTRFAMKQKSKADKIAESSQKLFARFRDLVEPRPAP